MRTMINIKALIALLTLSTFGLASCHMGDPSYVVTITPRDRATIDYDQAAISLPLEDYGMSSEEFRLVKAAASIEFARCVTGKRAVSKSVLAEARRGIKATIPDPNLNHWRYGIWNAKFVAKHGWLPFPQQNPEPELLPTDSDTAEKCLDSKAVRALDPIITSYTDGDEGPSTKLALATKQSYEAATKSRDFKALSLKYGVCLQRAGYKTKTSEGAVEADIDDNASDKAIGAAMLSSAKCNDSLNLTGQMADVEAKLQHMYIKTHEEELLEVKKIANKRVKRAKQILASVGIE